MLRKGFEGTFNVNVIYGNKGFEPPIWDPVMHSLGSTLESDTFGLEDFPDF